MTVEKYLPYRGALRAAVGVGSAVVFVTAHPEGRPTALYRLDADGYTLSESPLPCGGLALALDGETVWLAGTDAHVYRAGGRAAPSALGAKLAEPAAALVPVAGDRLAVLSGSDLVILSKADGSAAQTLELPGVGTALAVDPTGRWLAVGTDKGDVAIFDGETREEFTAAEREKVHEGAVTALLFEPDELRFLSAGTDQKLYTSYARGTLEPEEKGKGAGHTDAVTAMFWAAADRLVTGSRDGSAKTWPRTGNARPATLKDGMNKVVALAVVTVHTERRMVAACQDDSLRLFTLGDDGRFGDAVARVYGSLDLAAFELKTDDPARREAALTTLAGYDDAASLELVAKQADNDADAALRRRAAELLSASDQPRVPALLESRLKHNDEAVRVTSFRGLRRIRGERDLSVPDAALKANHADIGKLAVESLEKLASKDDQAMTRLVKAIDAQAGEVRQAALTSLERVHPNDSPEANLLGLRSSHADLRRLTLVRLMQRNLLDAPRVGAALRLRTEDADAEVRRAAFLLTLQTRPKLLAALRPLDPELDRQLTDLESGVVQMAPAAAVAADAPGSGAALAASAVHDFLQTAVAAGGMDPTKWAAEVEAAIDAAVSEVADDADESDEDEDTDEDDEDFDEDDEDAEDEE